MLSESSPLAGHPAAEWAIAQSFTPEQVDCTTAVVLKILDGKCQMLPGEKTAVMAIYRAVREQPGRLFNAQTHQLIEQAPQPVTTDIAASIHQQRLRAEAHIPKPVMKAYKAMLRTGLFGE